MPLEYDPERGGFIRPLSDEKIYDYFRNKRNLLLQRNPHLLLDNKGLLGFYTAERLEYVKCN